MNQLTFEPNDLERRGEWTEGFCFRSVTDRENERVRHNVFGHISALRIVVQIRAEERPDGEQI